MQKCEHKELNCGGGTTAMEAKEGFKPGSETDMHAVMMNQNPCSNDPTCMIYMNTK